VQQLWDYLAQLPETPWGILTNYRAVRLYHRDSPMRSYQEFKVADFSNPARIREFLYLFEPDGLLGSALAASRALDLLNNSQDRRLTVGDDLYDYYSNQPTPHRRQSLNKTTRPMMRFTPPKAARSSDLRRLLRGSRPAPHQLLENTWANVAPLSRAGALAKLSGYVRRHQ
jgi:hypothetical protein